MDASSLPSVDFLSTPFSPEKNDAQRAGQLPSHSAALDNPSHKNSALSFSASERFSLQLKTREGDDVTINFSNQASFQASLAGNQNPSSSSIGVSLESSSSSSFRFSVEGDLNEDEQQAINSLVKELSNIADKFFAGDVQDAFNNAAELNFDGSQLASLDFSLSQEVSYSRTASYESVQQLTAPGQQLKALQPLREGLREQLSAAEAVIEEAQTVTGSLLNSLIEQDSRYSQANAELKQQLDDNLATINALINNLGESSHGQQSPQAS